MLLIGLGHRARQGKNTAALAMLEAAPLGSHARLFAFADALRAEVKTAIRQCGSAHNLVEGFKEMGLMPDWVRAEYEGKQRSILQWWGTDYRRNQDPDYWTTRLFRTFEVLQPDIAFVTDVRFPNEAKAIKAAGGYLVKCERLTAPDIEVHEHPSEAALDGYTGWNYYLRAETVTELRVQARAAYREMESHAVSGHG